MKTLIAVTLSVGMVAFAGTAEAQLQLVNPVVVDSTNRVLGPIVGGDSSYPLVAFRVNNIIFALRILPNSYEGRAAPLVFTSTDCSGAPYMVNSYTSTFAPSAVVPPGHSVFVADPAGSPQTIDARSSLDSGGCYPTSGTVTGFPAIFMIQLDSEFVPPITVQHAP